jgi:hypothetical protein
MQSSYPISQQLVCRYTPLAVPRCNFQFRGMIPWAGMASDHRGDENENLICPHWILEINDSISPYQRQLRWIATGGLSVGMR